MTLPGNIGGAVPDGPDWLVRAVRDLQRDVAAQRTAIPRGTVKPEVFNAVSSGITLATSYANVEVATLAVPTGYTQAAVSATMTCAGYGRNNPSGNFGPTCRILVNGQASPEVVATAGNNTEALAVVSFAILLDTTSLSTVTIQAQAYDTLANMLAAASSASLSGTALFLR